MAVVYYSADYFLKIQKEIYVQRDGDANYPDLIIQTLYMH